MIFSSIIGCTGTSLTFQQTLNNVSLRHRHQHLTLIRSLFFSVTFSKQVFYYKSNQKVLVTLSLIMLSDSNFVLTLNVLVPSRTDFYSSVSHAVGGSATSPRSPTPRGGCFGSATLQTEAQRNEQLRRDPLNYNSAGSPICSTCDSAIV